MIEIIHVTLLMILFAGAVWDMQKREIPAYLPVIGFLFGFLLRMIAGLAGAAGLLGGCLPGLLMLVAGYLSKEAVGYGDGGMLICCGIYLTFSESMMLMIISLLLAAGSAGILLVFKRISRKEPLPFLPFLLAGYVILLAG